MALAILIGSASASLASIVVASLAFANAIHKRSQQSQQSHAMEAIAYEREALKPYMHQAVAQQRLAELTKWASSLDLPNLAQLGARNGWEHKE